MHCFWITGLSGAGKTTLGYELVKRLGPAVMLDGDRVRAGLCSDLGFSPEDRSENNRRIAETARLITESGISVVVCAISPYRKDRESARRHFAPGRFIEVFLDTPLKECERRDAKGYYARAHAGDTKDFTGVSAPYEAPLTPEVWLRGIEPPDRLARTVMKALDLMDLPDPRHRRSA